MSRDPTGRRHRPHPGDRPSRPRRIRAGTLMGEALGGVLARPSRLVLTTLGSALGLGALVATLGLAQTGASQVSRQFDAIAATQVSVEPVAPPPDSIGLPPAKLPFDAAARVGRLRGVVAAATITRLADTPPIHTVPIVDPNAIADPALPVLATSPGILATVLGTTTTGRFFDAGHDTRGDLVAVLGANAAARLDVSRVDTLPAVFIGARAFTVIGIIDGVVRHSELLDGVIIPEGTAHRVFGLQAPAQVQIRTAAGAAAQVARQAPIAISPNDPGSMSATASPSGSGLRARVAADVDALFVVLGLVALLAGAVGIANVMLLSVLERIGEIGLRRALGATRRDVAAQFLVESGIVGLLGGVVGASAGTIVTVTVSAARAWVPVLDVRLAVLAPLLGLLIGVVAGAFPAWRATTIEPITALRAT